MREREGEKERERKERERESNNQPALAPDSGFKICSLQFMPEFGPVQALFIETLLFLRCAYEPLRVHKKVKNIRRGPTPEQAKTVETPTKPGNQYIDEIVVLLSSIRAIDHEAILGFGGVLCHCVLLQNI